MSQNLVTRERAQQNVGQATFSAAELRQIDYFVAAASDAVRRWCRRDFVAASYDELYDGSGTPELPLRQYPVLAVERVATAPSAVLSVTNTATTTNQRAAVQVTKDGLTLTRTASGVVTVDTSVTWAAYPTLSQAAAALAALGNGWSGTVVGGYGSWPSADLRPIQGALACAGRAAAIMQHVEELSGYGVRAERGLLVYGAAGWLPLFPWEQPFDRPCWPRGRELFRVVYTAGYDSVPEAVQEACAEWAAALWWQAKRDPALARQQIPGAGFQVFATHDREVPANVRALLNPYRRHAIGDIP